MEFIRILPEMCASTLCPFSNSTRNCVLGSASVTVPSTSMTSSLAKDLLFSNSYKMAETKRISYHVGGAPPTDENASLYPPEPPFCVNTRGPFSVTATVFSKWAEREPSAVYIDHPSHSLRRMS